MYIYILFYGIKKIKKKEEAQSDDSISLGYI